jgi:alkylresorcinol/alkylpyrone synthase
MWRDRPEGDPPPRLLALATAVPAHPLPQGEVAAAAPGLFPERGEELTRLLPVYANAGIERRYSCQPLTDYQAPSDWRGRNARYIAGALDLLEQGAGRCLAEAGLEPQSVDALVTVSTTGLATPSLDARLMGRLSFRANVERLPVFGLGCAGGVLGLGRAAALAAARPGAKVLLLVVELCALTFRHGDHSNANIVASALFGDGAAAALVSVDESKAAEAPAIVHWGEHTWPDSLEVMGWSVENDGLGVVFSQDIPTLVRRDLGATLDAYLARHGLTRGDIDHYVSHPGGAKVVRALEEVFGLQRGALVEAREVLRDYGNMSAASVFFVLEAARRRHGLGGRQLLSALGPGFTAAFATLEGPGTRAPIGLRRAAAAE